MDNPQSKSDKSILLLKTHIKSSKTPPVSPRYPISPRYIPATPRVINTPSQFLGKSYSPPHIQNITPDIISKCGRMISRAMYNGHPYIYFGKIKIYEDFFINLVGDKVVSNMITTPSIRHRLSHQKVINEHSGEYITCLLKPRYLKFTQWLEKSNGLKWTLAVKIKPKCKTSPFIGIPRLKEWAQFIIYFEPIIELETDLNSIWNSQVNVKCLDTSSYKKWFKMGQNSIRNGYPFFILSTLYKNSDFSLKEKDSIVCKDPREFLTFNKLYGIDKIYINGKKFEIMIQWIQQQKLEWTLLLSEDQNWAYLCCFI